MKLYIDDIRPAPDGWMQARTITEAIRTIAQFGDEITEISLDHDISLAVSVDGVYRPFPSPDTFQAVAYFIVSFYAEKPKPQITIHTANPVGAKSLFEILKDGSDMVDEYDINTEPAMRVNRLESEV